MLIFFYLILFFLWAVFGSFGGVIIERGRWWFARGEWGKVFGGRSYCPSCKHTLTRWQLIPLGGWLLQKGKCFRCNLSIPAWYLWEELVMGMVFVVTWRTIVWFDTTLLVDTHVTMQLLFWLVVNWWLVLLLLADLLWYELNLYVRIILMVAIACFQVFGGIGDWQMMIIGGLVLSCLFYGIYLGAARRQTAKQGEFTEWFGLGDVWMAGLVGSLVGVVFPEWTILLWIQLVLLYLVLSSSLGIVFRWARNVLTKNQEDQMPFLPAMIVAIRLIVIFQDTMMQYIW